MDDESLSVEYKTLRISAAAIMGIMSLTGIFLNGSVFYNLISQKGKLGGFYTLCTSKTISNSIICLTFLIWAVPCTSFNSYYLPLRINIIFGQYGGWMAYIMGPFTQLCMAVNRLCALFLPHYYSRSYSLPITLIGILILWIVSFTITSFGLPVGCGFIYVIKRLAWEPQSSECAVQFSLAYFYLIVAISVFANSFNTVIAVKLLLSSKSAELSQNVSAERRKKRIRMYIQSVSQDCLHLMDTINCSIISHLRHEIWYQFVFSSLSFLGIHVLDGLVMIFFNQQLRPKCFSRKAAVTCETKYLAQRKTCTEGSNQFNLSNTPN